MSDLSALYWGGKAGFNVELGTASRADQEGNLRRKAWTPNYFVVATKW